MRISERAANRMNVCMNCSERMSTLGILALRASRREHDNAHACSTHTRHSMRNGIKRTTTTRTTCVLLACQVWHIVWEWVRERALRASTLGEWGGRGVEERGLWWGEVKVINSLDTILHYSRQNTRDRKMNMWCVLYVLCVLANVCKAHQPQSFLHTTEPSNAQREAAYKFILSWCVYARKFCVCFPYAGVFFFCVWLLTFGPRHGACETMEGASFPDDLSPSCVHGTRARIPPLHLFRFAAGLWAWGHHIPYDGAFQKSTRGDKRTRALSVSKL